MMLLTENKFISSLLCQMYRLLELVVNPNNFHFFRLERRRELSARYWFECQCLACSKNWQLLDALPKDPGFKDEKVEKVEDFMAKGDVSNALNSLIPKLCETSTQRCVLPVSFPLDLLLAY